MSGAKGSSAKGSSAEKIALLEEAMTLVRQESRALEEVNNLLKVQVDVYQRENQQQKKIIKELARRAQQAKVDLEAYMAMDDELDEGPPPQMDSYKEQASQLLLRLDEFHRKLELTEGERDQLLQRVTASDAKLVEMTLAMQAATKQIKDHRAESSGLQKRLASLERDRAEVSGRLDGSLKKNTKLSADLGQAQDAAKKAAGEHKVSVAALQQQNALLVERIRVLEVETADAPRLKMDLARAQEEAAKAVQERDLAVAALEMAKETHRNLVADWAQEKAVLDQRIQSLIAEIERLRAQCAEQERVMRERNGLSAEFLKPVLEDLVRGVAQEAARAAVGGATAETERVLSLRVEKKMEGQAESLRALVEQIGALMTQIAAMRSSMGLPVTPSMMFYPHHAAGMVMPGRPPLPPSSFSSFGRPY